MRMRGDSSYPSDRSLGWPRQAPGTEPIAVPEVPAPEVVNAQVPRRRPPDPLDGPPFVTARAWAVGALSPAADGGTFT